MIDTHQTYYGLAVRANTDDAVKMAQAIWAGLFHRYSTDANATQNANEAFIGVVWRMCPKEFNAGRGVVELAANLATCTFNDGAMSLCQALEEMSCSVGHNTIKALKKEDTDRIAHAEVASSALQKSTRKKRRKKKRKRAGRAKNRARRCHI